MNFSLTDDDVPSHTSSSHTWSPTAVARDQLTPASRRILVVDDDPVLRKTTTELLRRVGYTVSCAEDGEAGWNAFCEEPCDLIITDHEMPRLTGLALLRRVRASSLPVPVILISGRMPWREPDLPQLLQPGTMLDKPFSWVDLLTAIRDFLGPPVHARNGDGQLLLNPDPA